MQSQVCEAHLVQRSAKVVHTLLTLSTKLYVTPQEGETLRAHVGFKRTAYRTELCTETNKLYLQHQRVPFSHKLLRCHVEEGETHKQAVQRIAGLSLEGLNILTCKHSQCLKNVRLCKVDQV